MMTMRLPFALCVLLLPAAVRAAPIDFNRDVRPILSGQCLKCHGIDDKARKGKLRLDVREAALAPAKSGARAIVAGKPDESELVKRIFTSDEDDLMPPPSTKRELTAQQKQILKQWIAEGAAYAEHWAFVAPKQLPLPEVKQKDWPRNAIDRFILARLEAEGLSPSREADRYTLAKRVYLDLIGLPPTPEEADAFVNDKAPNAYEAMVDRLLVSPQYGERWARKWLDLARYADTNGYEKDRPRSMWPWRDWVVGALNADMPFDQFTVEQLAGDMLPNATQAQKIATGFHRNTMINEEGGIDPLEYRFHSMVDRVGTTGTTWLGMTIACAQCHTHKYDPVTQVEYYRLMACINNADEPVMELTTAEIEQKRQEAHAKAEKLIDALPSKFPVGDMKWTVASGTVTSSGGAKVEKQPDGSLKFTGEVPDVDSYAFSFDTDATPVDRLKLETFVTGKSGPGRTAHGNFVLTEVVVTVAPKDKPFEAKTIKLARAEADFSQDKFPIAHAIDAKPKTGWGVAGDGQKNRTATFHFDKPVSFPGGARWTVRLDQNYGQKHTIAHARLSLGGKVEDSRPAEERRQDRLDKAYSAWLAANTAGATTWSVIRPTAMTSNAPTMTLLEDGSVLVSGDITKSDKLDLTFPVDAAAITAVRLEMLPHPSLPNNGPGKVHYEGPIGDFFLSEISMTADGKPAPFADAVQSFANGNNTAKKAIDGDQQSGWSINGGQGKAHHAVFVLKDATGPTKELKLHLLCEKYYAATLGRFRVWISTDPRAGKTIPQPPEIETALAVPTEKRNDAQKAAIFRQWLLVAPELAEARKEVDAARNAYPKPGTTLVMTERPAGHTRSTHLHNRGEFLQPRDAVEPGLPAFLGNAPAGQPMDRLTFARWLVNGENPLTGRVTVNRSWAAFFNRGLVRTTEDFGFQGELPSHPELLDWLAVEVVKQKWSMKALHRLIVTSAAYRQSSHVTPALLVKDPQNILLARGPRFRAEAEMVRDGALKASGLLSLKMGGPGVYPPQIPSVTTEGTYGPLQWKVSTGEDRYRRSLYTFMKRTAPFALYSTFDAPSGEACVARREVSNTPLQALSLLNDQVFVDAAQAMGRLTAALPGDDLAKASALFRRVLVRPAQQDELESLMSFVTAQRARFASKELDAAKVAGEGEGNPVERATWTVVARALMNLDEAVTKN